MSEHIFIALAGNPNCGKTTLFNELTGSNGYVGNWPGVTVEKKMATWKANHTVTFVDLPGIYSLSPYSPEEVVSRDYVVNNAAMISDAKGGAAAGADTKGAATTNAAVKADPISSNEEAPDVIINVVDVTNLERNLYLTTQLLETGRPVVVALNMCDLLKERGDVIDTAALSKKLGAEVVEISALKKKNLDVLVQKAIDEANAHVQPKPADCFSSDVESALTSIQSVLTDASANQPAIPAQLVRWYTVKAFERDEDALAALQLSENQLERIEAIIASVEKNFDDDSESIITGERYDWIATLMDDCVKRAPKKLTTSQKIDRVVTNRWLGLPIFAVIMIAVYWIALVAVGTPATDWVNDNLFSDGFFVNAAGGQAYEEAHEEYLSHHYSDQVDGYIAAAAEAGINTDGVADALAAEEPTPEDEALIAQFEAEAAKAGVVAKNVVIHDEDGNFVTTEGDTVTSLDDQGNPILEPSQSLDVIPTVSFAEFKKAVEVSEPDKHDYAGYVESIPDAAKSALESAGTSELIQSLVIDGVIGGVGSVLGFIPQIVVLFVLLCFLEDCGYMSRVAFVMDRVFRRFGLSGKSFIPMIVSSGCGVPGVLATKTIENERDRRMTAMLTTMIPCSAKLPIIGLVMGVLAGGSNMWWVAPLFYFLGILAIIVSAVMLKKTKPFQGDPIPFVMELPDYHLPALRSWALHVWERVFAYIRKAGTIIFAAAMGIWVLSNFGFASWEGGTGTFGFLPTAEAAPETYMDYSILAAIGGFLSFIFLPLGFGNWQATASTISALIAKENLVSTFGVLYGLGDATENSVSMWQGFAGMFTVNGVMHIGAMCAFVAFNMLCAPCFAAMGAIRKQMGSPCWTSFAIGYECGFAWVIGLFINQFYELIVFGNFGFWTVVAFVLLALMLFQIFRPAPKANVSEKVHLGQVAKENA